MLIYYGQGGLHMICKKCKSNSVIVQAVTETKTKRRGIFYWLFFGWLIDIFLWIFLTLPRLIVALFRSRKIISKTTTQAICQTCGYRWKV